jgi:hypothetical protein
VEEYERRGRCQPFCLSRCRTISTGGAQKAKTIGGPRFILGTRQLIIQPDKAIGCVLFVRQWRISSAFLIVFSHFLRPLGPSHCPISSHSFPSAEPNALLPSRPLPSLAPPASLPTASATCAHHPASTAPGRSWSYRFPIQNAQDPAAGHFLLISRSKRSHIPVPARSPFHQQLKLAHFPWIQCRVMVLDSRRWWGQGEEMQVIK